MSQVLSGGRVLSFNSALVSDTGRYTCVAVNAGGEQQREYDLRVYGESNWSIRHVCRYSALSHTDMCFYVRLNTRLYM